MYKIHVKYLYFLGMFNPVGKANLLYPSHVSGNLCLVDVTEIEI